MKFLQMIGICGCLLFGELLLPLRGFAAAITPQEAELYFTSSLVSMAAYSEGLNIMTREWLQQSGWYFDSRENLNRVADGRFHLVSRNLRRNQSVYFLAFPGTERLKDAEIDFRVKRVVFGGKTPQEFKAMAALGDHNGAQPLVHQGFNDYIQVALFQQPLNEFGNRTAGEFLAQELRENPNEILYLTGHSLGGASATLAAARFADLGVRPEQLQVVTFGAPAVGNETFARLYEHKMNLTRITMAADPVKSVLQSLTGGFVQFGKKIVWKNNKSERFAHDMVLYLDQSLRAYQDTHPENELTPAMLQGTPVKLSGGVYVAPFEFKLDKKLQPDLPYMRRTLRESLKQDYAPVILSESKEKKSLAELCAEQKQAGCRYVLLERFTGNRIRKEHNNFHMIMEEELYDTDGNLLTMQTTSASTKNLTPIEAMVYLQFQAKEQRDQFLQ
ncbi:MAG: lipase family protein [Selenomonas sp.]|uniref:lipase family protein n=1 Tax=Selenomonas sp. TaxID=2053611 RepID=UPI0025EFB4B1|nr:lipase family protein [Selenomonas sp.]MCR5438205.1 lipase family protein [Selenomonas sp.]